MSKPSQYSREEEIANVVTHALGVLFGFVALPFTIIKVGKTDNVFSLIGVVVFCMGFVLMFLSSTLYHSMIEQEVKWSLKKLDHISIFIMIAGSYTPFILIYFMVPIGLTLLTAMWILVALGTIFKLYTTGKFRYISTMIYAAMGLAVFLISDKFFPLLPAHVFYYILLGGILYLLGIVFYLWKVVKYNHAIWHLFVLAGAICHWWAVHCSIV